jgi:hypothetical protein
MENERVLDVSQQAPAGLAALYGPDAVPLALALTAQIALRRPVWVIDGGNRFDALWLAEYIARGGQAPEPVLDRINISRAFTCHQMAERILSLPVEAAPLVILHLLDTFYDENVPITEARRLLNALWPTLRRRSRGVPVALTVHPPRSERVADRESFYAGILRRADRRVGPEQEDPPAAPPLRLFPVTDLEGRTAGLPPGHNLSGAGSRSGGPPLWADPGTQRDRDFRHPLPPVTDLTSSPRPRPGIAPGLGHPSPPSPLDASGTGLKRRRGGDGGREVGSGG